MTSSDSDSRSSELAALDNHASPKPAKSELIISVSTGPGTSDSEPSEPQSPSPTFTAVGSPSMTCPQIRKSSCMFFFWDRSSSPGIWGKHIETPCPFKFVSERAYQYHVAEVHCFDLEWMEQWYVEPLYARDFGGRLPRYQPAAEEGVCVVDRKVREDPGRLGRVLMMFLDGPRKRREQDQVSD
ncbi:unnamed protein product [Discula destructiva]